MYLNIKNAALKSLNPKQKKITSVVSNQDKSQFAMQSGPGHCILCKVHPSQKAWKPLLSSPFNNAL